MRLVLDLNTLVSGLLWQGAPRHLVNLARAGRFELVSSAVLMIELDDVLHRDKFVRQIQRAGLTADGMIADLARIAQLVLPAELPQPVCRDPDDDDVLAAALAGEVDAIVSGDRDLTDLQRFRGIPILHVQEAIARVEQAPE